MSYPSRAIIDHAALAHNYAVIAGRTAAEVMPIVKADAYGHGLVPCVATLHRAGAAIVGVAQLAEALELAAALNGTGPTIFTWLYSPHQRAELRAAIRAGLHLSVPDHWALAAISQAYADLAAEDAGREPALPRVAVHLKVDTGMGRGGVLAEDAPALIAAALDTEGIDVIGIWSHLARADDDAATTARQEATFERVLAEARAAGATIDYAHLAAAGGTLWHPATHHTHVRPGIALYGIMPDDSDPAAANLRPVMRLEADLTMVKRVPAGTPVSYGHTQTVAATTLGIVPLGYADGMDRHASSRARVRVGAREAGVVGRICMDQFIIDLGPDSPAEPGDAAIVWGPGGPSVSDWARAAGTIGYEMVARLGPRVPRIHINEDKP